MKKFSLFRLNRALHRDLGYLLFALSVVYGLSGIALNHLDSWNPNYIVITKEVNVTLPKKAYGASPEVVKEWLGQVDDADRYKQHIFPDSTSVKIYTKDGTLWIDLETGDGTLDISRRRPIFNQVNFLHYNPGKWWPWVADAFAGGLIVLAISGLFMVKGKNGFKWRGLILATIGLAVPAIFLLLYY